MTAGAGVLRSAESLASAAEVVHNLAGEARPPDRAALELANLATLAQVLLASASARVESRGAHTRTDFPSTDPDWRVRLVHA